MSSLAVPLPRVHAVTREVPAPDDLLDALGGVGFAWIEGRAGFVATGTVARLPLDDVGPFLRRVQVDDAVGAPGTGAIAVGALPFDRDRTATLVVPEWVVGRSNDGRSWITQIGTGSCAAPARGRARGGTRLRLGAVPCPRPVVRRTPAPRASRVLVHEAQSRSWWDRAVAEVLDAIARGALAKVVLAREVHVEADGPIETRSVLRRLRAQQPGCILYAHDGLVGASPELLVRRCGRTVESRPMAGTAPAGADDEAVAALVGSAKDAAEHRFVVDAVRAALAPSCAELDAPAMPAVERFGSLAHLVSVVRGTMAASRPGTPAPDALDLARVLHPTPAVGGTPTPAALAMIRRLEPFDRGRYAGPVGWVDGHGDGAWAVALRGAEVDGTRAVLRAGAGIVAGSRPEAEWAETTAKLEPMLRALTP